MKGTRQRGRSTTRFTALVLITGLAVVATAGLAAGALKTKTTSILLPAQSDEDSGTAKCKRGFRAVSGGFDGPGFAANTGSFQIPIDSFRQGRRTWVASAYNDGDAGLFITSVNCSDEFPKLKVASATGTTPPDDVGSVTVICPRPTKVVSGGFEPEVQATENDQLNFVYESQRSGKRTWTVSAGNGTVSPLDLTAYAYCVQKRLKLKARVSTVSRDSDGNLTATAECKRSERAVAGGFSANGEVDGSYAQPFESQREGKRAWTASVGAFVGVDPFEWTTTAYCVKKNAT